MDELLKQIVVLVSKCEFTAEQKSKNIIARLIDAPEPILKSLGSGNNFSKGKDNRGTAKTQNYRNQEGNYNKGGDKRHYERDNRDNRNKNFRDERPATDEWRAEEDEMV